MWRTILKFCVMFVLVFLALIGLYAGINGRIPQFLNPQQTARAHNTEELRRVLQGQELGMRAQGSPLLTQLNRERTELVQRVLPSVVSITTTKLIREVRQIRPSLRDMLLRQERPRYEVEDRLAGGFGSGVIISSDGLILTSYHVIDGKSDIILLLNDGRQLAGEVVASDPAADLAVVRVQAEDLNPLPLGKASDVQPGELVCAVGNPYGLRETVSWGSISSLDRVEAEGGGREMIQHDATLHRGHSGGPLVNVRGELIGINRSIFSDQNTGTWQGIGFAVPANVIRGSLRRMLAGYDEKDPLPGLRLKGSISSEDRQTLDLGLHEGVLLEQVYPNSPAARQGLLPDDLIMGINGRSTPDLLTMQHQLQGVARGDILEFHLIRGGLPLSLRIRIPEESEEFQSL